MPGKATIATIASTAIIAITTRTTRGTIRAGRTRTTGVRISIRFSAAVGLIGTASTITTTITTTTIIGALLTVYSRRLRAIIVSIYDLI